MHVLEHRCPVPPSVAVGDGAAECQVGTGRYTAGDLVVDRVAKILACQRPEPTVGLRRIGHCVGLECLK